MLPIFTLSGLIVGLTGLTLIAKLLGAPDVFTGVGMLFAGAGVLALFFLIQSRIEGDAA